MARFLSTLLIAIAMFSAPFAMHVGRAMEAPAAIGKGQGCEGMAHPAPDKQKSNSAANCAAACAAIPGVQAVMPAEALFAKAEPFIGPAHRLTGIRPEAEMPPPRATPAI